MTAMVQHELPSTVGALRPDLVEGEDGKQLLYFTRTKTTRRQSGPTNIAYLSNRSGAFSCLPKKWAQVATQHAQCGRLLPAEELGAID